MKRLKDLFIKAAKAVKYEYTRLDRTCNCCGVEIFGGDTLAKELFCEECYKSLPFNNGNICTHCGRSTVNAEQRCNDCAGFETTFKAARSPFYYATPINKLVRKQKYDNHRYLAKVFGVFLAEYCIKFFSDAEFITFVPMTKEKLKERGFNQSELMAKDVSLKTGIPYGDALEKVKETERQARLGRDERLSNLEGSFKVRNRALIDGKTVLLIDDVLTTGATAEAVSKALKKGGAKEIYVLTVASVTDGYIARALGQEVSSSASKRVKKLMNRKKG